MRIKVKHLVVFGLLSLALGTQLKAASDDLRLVEATKHRDSKSISLLLKQLVDVNTPQPDGATPLHWSTHWNDLETVDLLLRAGANVNASNDFGVTPLSLACTNGSVTMVQKLLKAGADSNAVLPSGETLLMTAARTGNADVISTLLNNGADIHAREITKKQTALMWTVSESHLEAARTLIDHGAEVQARSASDFTPLLFAARQGNLDMVHLLLASGSDVNETAADGSTPLLITTVLGHFELAEFFLKAGANPNADGAGYTALHWIAGTWESHMTPQFEHTPRAERWFGLPSTRRITFAQTLLNYGANPNSRLLKQPPRYGSSIIARNYFIGGTPFYLAASAGNVDMMELLLSRGADPLLMAENKTTALTMAAGLTFLKSESIQPENNHLEAVRLCVEVGIDINAVNDTGDTALHGAAFAGFDTIAEFLVNAGADMHLKNINLQTPLGVAEGGRCCSSNSMMVYKQESTASLLRRLDSLGD